SSPVKQVRGRSANPRRHNPGSYEKLYGATLRPPCNWRERFLSESSPPGYARIAITRATVRPEHDVAIVEVVGDESRGCGIHPCSCVDSIVRGTDITSSGCSLGNGGSPDLQPH